MWDGFLILLLVVSVVGVLGLLVIGMSELRAEKPAMDSGRQRAGSRQVADKLARVHHLAHRRMCPVLHLDPMLRLGESSGSVAALRGSQERPGPVLKYSVKYQWHACASNKEGRTMKSPVVKRSILLGGRKTSVSLEGAFWSGMKEISEERGKALYELIGEIDRKRQNSNLSSAIRVFVLDHFRTCAEGPG